MSYYEDLQRAEALKEALTQGPERMVYVHNPGYDVRLKAWVSGYWVKAGQPEPPALIQYFEIDQRFVVDERPLAIIAGAKAFMLAADDLRLRNVVTGLKWFAKTETATKARQRVTPIRTKQFTLTTGMWGCVFNSEPGDVWLNIDQPAKGLVRTTFHEVRHVEQLQKYGPFTEDDSPELEQDARDYAERMVQRHGPALYAEIERWTLPADADTEERLSA